MKKIFTLVAFATFLTSYNTNAQCVGDRYKFQIFSTVTTTSDILYGNNIDLQGTPQDLLMDVHEPTGDIVTNRPLIILAHGGNFLGGSKTDTDVLPLAQDFAKMGYVVASIDYRIGFNNFPIPGPDSVDATETVVRTVHDFRAAIRYFKQDYSIGGNTFGIDTTKIIIGGVSAGAISALHVAYLDELSELPSYIDTTQAGLGGGIEGESGNPGYTSKGAIGIINIAGALRDTSWMTSTSMPLLSLHGDIDDVVPYGTAIITLLGFVDIMKVHGSFTVEKRATNLGVNNCLFTHYGATHTPHVGSIPYTDTTESLMRNFLANLLCGDALVCGYNGGIILGVDEDFSENDVKVYPNPSNGVINIAGLNNSSSTAIKVYNLLGELLFTDNNETQIDLSNFPKGIYLLRIETKNGVLSKKIELK